MNGAVAVIGAGPTGALLAIFLRELGLDVTVYERRPDPRRSPAMAGRSINLALADRGIHALRLAGVYDAVAPFMMPMRGRMIHPREGTQSLLLYGQRANEVIYSVSRRQLTQVLLDVAMHRHGVDVKFEHCVGSVDFETGNAEILGPPGQSSVRVVMQPLLATDGAGSLVRHRMASAGLIEVHEAPLEHGYKELSIPAAHGGDHRMACDALHIWPRGDFMLIALPNRDGSFTATLFLPTRGASSFEALETPAKIERFLSDHFPDVVPLMPDCVGEFQDHPTGSLGTVYAAPWSVRGSAVLVGDAAHAIVPFHGQGMNCCFEDCVDFVACAKRQTTWEAVFADFFAQRKLNTDAIAAMALENYLEMRERVSEPRFRLQQGLALELERRHPRNFVPRYSMVMFHHEISYSEAQTRGLIQARLLDELTTQAVTLEDVDYQRAAREIELKLPPLWVDSAM